MSALDIVMQLFGYVGAALISIVSLPELINFIKTRKTYHINLILFSLLTIASICFVISGFYSFGTGISKGFNPELAFVISTSIANVCSGTIGGIVLIAKIIHKVKAKKLGVNEQEYYEQKIAPKIKSKKQ